MKEHERPKIEELLRLDVDGLMNLLPAYDPQYEHTMFAPQGQLQAGREIFERLKKQLHRCVCIEWKYCEKKKSDKYQDPVLLVASVADVIATVSMSIPPFVIATLLFKIGLSSFCECK